MKKTMFLLLAAVSVMAISCGDSIKREQNRVYMPDMAYSRAYETYADHSNLKDEGIYYDNLPVAGTVSRTESYVYHLGKDKTGDTTNYVASRGVHNPVNTLSEAEFAETERLYLVNCGICHGGKLDGNGPLWKDGSGPFPAKPATLVGDAKYDAMTPGTMFYSITYGRNLMGSYASQLTVKQRWDIVYYIKSKQAEKNGTPLPGAPAAPAAGDSTAASAPTAAAADSMSSSR